MTASGHIKRVDEAEQLLILEEETRSRWKIFMKSRECKKEVLQVCIIGILRRRKCL